MEGIGNGEDARSASDRTSSKTVPYAIKALLSSGREAVLIPDEDGAIGSVVPATLVFGCALTVGDCSSCSVSAAAASSAIEPRLTCSSGAPSAAFDVLSAAGSASLFTSSSQIRTSCDPTSRRLAGSSRGADSCCGGHRGVSPPTGRRRDIGGSPLLLASSSSASLDSSVASEETDECEPCLFQVPPRALAPRYSATPSNIDASSCSDAVALGSDAAQGV
mmetsp:Transcript_605/g.2050  ORF Transcript_605/g.2050 Transcript_605/m.2050 type:complete len:220 (+) Transcript_605:398-1057(+)